MAASLVNHISSSLRNCLNISLHGNSRITCTTDLFSNLFRKPKTTCIPIRFCSEQPRPNNHQRPLLNWATNRDYNHRLLVKQYGPLRQRLACLRKNKILPKELQEIASAEVHALPRRSSVTHTYPRCIITGKGKGRLKRWRMGRIPWRLCYRDSWQTFRP